MTLPALPAQGSTAWYPWASGIHTIAASTGLNVKAYGATGNGSTDDTAAINSAITANAGKTVVFPPGTYMVNATANSGVASPVGIKLNQPKVRLELTPGAVIKMISSNVAGHSVIQVTAADCAIVGGMIVGDLQTHTDSGAGFFGWGIDVNAGADRLLIADITIREMWGDGILVMGAAQDTAIVNVTSIYNARQGCSVIDSVRTRILGGFYGHTGRIRVADDPAAGIDLEPDPGTTRNVIDCLVSGVLFADNVGPGFVCAGNGQILTATVVGCRSVGNGSSSTGFTGNYRIYSASSKVRFINCDAEGALAGDGFFTLSDTQGIQLIGCTSNGNPGNGFMLNGTRTFVSGCVATGNAQNGVQSAPGSVSSLITGTTASGNGTGGVYTAQFDIYAAGSRLTGCIADAAGVSATNYGYVIRSGATNVKVIGSTAVGTFSAGNALAQPGDTVLSPAP